jgi:hypothetical protein
LPAKVVAVHAHIQASHRNGVSPNALQLPAEAMREVDAAALNPDERHRLAVFMAFRDFVGNAHQHPVDGGGV